MFIKGHVSPSGIDFGTDTFSFSKGKDETLRELGDGISILAKKSTDYSPEHFTLDFYEVPPNVANDFEPNGLGTDRASTLRVTKQASIVGSKWRLQLLRAEIALQVSEKEWEYIPDVQEDEIRKQTVVGALVGAIRRVTMINQHQMVLQVHYGSELMELMQYHRSAYPGVEKCNDDCLICKTEDTMNELEQHMAIANSSSRPEPFGEIGAGILEKIMLIARDNPLFLLNTIFVNALYKIGLELAREELPLVVITKHGSLPKFDRLHEIYRFITKSKFEAAESVENLGKNKLFGKYPTTINVFNQIDANLNGEKLMCIHAAINYKSCISLGPKITIRMLNWDGNPTTLPYAVPSNTKYTASVRPTAFEGGKSFADKEILYPDDKYDTDNLEYFIKPNMDTAELNAEIPSVALFLELVNNASRTIIN